MRIEPPLSIRIISSDTLASSGLKALLEGEEFEVCDDRGASIDALLVDLQAHGAQHRNWRVGPPVLALAPDARSARQALAEGAAGVLSRQGDPGRIGPAFKAIESGLRVVDPDFLSGVLDPVDVPTDVHLSEREVEVLSLMATGMSNKEVGASLFISVHTVKFHLHRALQKLGARNRTEAVVMAGRYGLI